MWVVSGLGRGCLGVFRETVGATIGQPQEASEDEHGAGNQEDLVPPALMGKKLLHGQHCGLQGDGCAVGVEDLAHVHDLGDGGDSVHHDPLDARLERL